ncbi:MAG: hypothetical protein LUC22_06425 [Prevotella sp.]|nr:hypothetical protein [Prevotella sp.]
MASAKDVRKISVTPSTAKIYVDGNYIGDGVVEVTMNRKDDFVVLKFEEEGYLPLEVKLFTSDKRKSISYTLRRDAYYDVTVESGSVNKYFAVTVSKDLYTEDANGKRNTEKAWKMIHQVLLNYFDEIQTTDMASGFVQTPWKYKTLTEAEKVARTRVSVKETNIGGDLTFQIKVSSEVAPVIGANRDESYREVNRVLKEMEPLISEFQTRLGKM